MPTQQGVLGRGEDVETVYGNGAELGLAKAVGSQPLTARGRTARERLGTR